MSSSVTYKLWSLQVFVKGLHKTMTLGFNPWLTVQHVKKHLGMKAGESSRAAPF